MPNHRVPTKYVQYSNTFPVLLTVEQLQRILKSVQLYLLYRIYIYDEDDIRKRTHRQQLHTAFRF